MSNDTETLRFMMKDITNRMEKLNEWEETFIADIEERITNNKPLSEKQESKLDQIYEKVTENG